MRRNLISEWSAGEHSGQLFMVEGTHTDGDQNLKPEDSIQIVLELGHNSQKGNIRFFWHESEDLIQGVTEILITTYEQLEEEMIIGILLSKIENIFFGWSPFLAHADCGLMLSQGDEKIVVHRSHAVDFFRWLKNSLQLVGRIVS